MEKLLSELKYSDILFKLSKEDITQIVFETKNIVNEEVKTKYDIGIIFGGVSMIPNRVAKGLELLEKGIVKKLVVTGKKGLGSLFQNKKEANIMAKYLIEKGVPECDIIIENRSKNTIENIKNTLEILKSNYKDIKKLKYILVTSEFHIKRCLRLFKNELGSEAKIIGCAIHDGKRDKINWSQSKIGRNQIMLEALILLRYAKQKRIKDIKIKI